MPIHAIRSTPTFIFDTCAILHTPCIIRYGICKVHGHTFIKLSFFMNFSARPVAALCIAFILLLVAIYGVAAIIN